MSETAGGLLALGLPIGLGVLFFAWQLVLPVIGLLWLMGWLA